MSIYALAMDVLALAILIFSAVYYAHRGFASALVHFAGYFLAAFGASALSQWLAPQAANLLRPQVEEMVASSWEQLTAARSGQAADGLLGMLFSLTDADFSTGVQGVTDSLISAGLSWLLSGVFWLIFFLLLLVLVRFVAKRLQIINRVPLLGTANGFLGGVLGLLVGCVWVVLYLIILSFFASALGGEMQSGLQESYLCGSIISWMRV